jgi:5-methylthioadenosine/S-adenosylhomocysteine deaminase
MKLASGIAPVISMLQKAIPVALGTDGSASNNTLDLFKEMSVAAKLHKAQTLDPTATDARTVFRMATIEGAKALGLDRSVGSLEPGKLADVVIVGTDSPHFMPMYDPVSHLIYVAQGSDVRDVMIGGKWVVRNRKVVTLDMERIAWDIRNIAGSIKPRGIRQTP